jgi:hypothetical protein
VGDDGFTLVISASPKRLEGSRGRSSAPLSVEEASLGVEGTVSAVCRACKALRGHPFSRTLSEVVIDGDGPWVCTAIGLGQPSLSSVAQWQLAQFVLLGVSMGHCSMSVDADTGILSVSAPDVWATAFDPCFSEDDVQALERLGVAAAGTAPGVSDVDAWSAQWKGEAARRLVFMPHCPEALNAAVMQSLEGTGHLQRSVLVANSMGRLGASEEGCSRDETATIARLIHEGRLGGSEWRTEEVHVGLEGAARTTVYPEASLVASGAASSLRDLSVAAHPSGRGDPVFLAFSGVSVHRFDRVRDEE